ncbi:glycine cleavage system protein T [Cupriavidus sp. USMAA2-4]|uniref:Aminomethyltransferase n=1 Tax=Cupriavidus malaysiensis TaxID=367825 RepID=A0ABM6EZU5_9BURK|nr:MULTISPECIES: glycine cleavage system aminomethyltransferase GcvT [Cupriavidus]AOY92356.1 glycine cleavage system protein T [Cupriavidus sp. USMAA2-4]AOY98062.1 glycine cleavage system protein T [Cupriavidus sp. USMAHM13]AOZ04491.1 glycine cleavage system protein T [Cupriavidus malaysiensis]
MTLQATPLNAIHRALGARMVDFGGWDMPVNYGSQIEEHHAVRSDAGMFDVSHMCVVDLAGPHVRAFLRGLLANNVDKLQTPGKALYSCMLDDKGHVIDDLIVYFFAEDRFRLVVNASTAPTDIEWIRARNAATGSGVAITPRRADNAPAGVAPLAIVAVQGPNARAKVWGAFPSTQPSEALKPFNALVVQDPAIGEIMVARTGYTGEDGFELVVPADNVAAVWEKLDAAGVRPAGLGARDTLRLEAGMNLYGQDMDIHTSPLDAGLAWTVDLQSERDFTGKAALLADGQKAAFAGLVLRDKGGVLRAHQTVVTPAGNGETTSGTFSPTLSLSIAFARLPLGAQPGDSVEVEIRGRKLAATVVKLPFVRNGKALVS